MTKVIIDTDPGVDDALALMMAMCSNLEIIGITTVFGNSSVANSTRNARYITSLFNASIGVYQGASRPSKGRSKRASSHGSSGLGDTDIPSLTTETNISADTFLIQALASTDSPIDIVAIGPVTTIAWLSKKRPDLIKNIGKLIILGGVVDQPGNISQYAEFNAYNDPWALKAVLAALPQSVLIPADVCRNVVFNEATFDKLENPKLRTSIRALTAQYIDYYRNNGEYGRFTGGVMYDLLAICYLLRPDIFETERLRIAVETDPARYGETRRSNDGIECTVVRSVDASALEREFITVMNG